MKCKMPMAAAADPPGPRRRPGRRSRLRAAGVICALIAVVWVPVPVRAQAQPQPGAQAVCTYDTCALRVQAATFTQPPWLVRGVASEQIMPLTSFGDPVAPHFQPSDSAYAQALRYDRITPTAGVLSIAGPALLILGPFLTNWRERPIASFSLLAGGLGMTLYGTHLANTASDALNRAIWWHNRELR
jgi:hypothetical protein